MLNYRPGQPGARPSGDTRVSLAQTKPLASPSLGAKPLASSSLGAKSLASSSSGAKSINIPSHIGVGISPQVIYKIFKKSNYEKITLKKIYLSQDTKARKVNRGRVYSAYILKPVLSGRNL